MNDGDTPQGAYGIPPREFRLPEATHMGAVHLQVSDLQRSVAYYEQVIGRAPDLHRDDRHGLTGS